MARYVLIQFDDNLDAEGFVKMLNEADGPEKRMFAVAVFAKPTMFCTCPEPSEKSVRGAKWGWWLCKNPGCGKPKSGQWQQPRDLTLPEGTTPDQRHVFLNIREAHSER